MADEAIWWDLYKKQIKLTIPEQAEHCNNLKRHSQILFTCLYGKIQAAYTTLSMAQSWQLRIEFIGKTRDKKIHSEKMQNCSQQSVWYLAEQKSWFLQTLNYKKERDRKVMGKHFKYIWSSDLTLIVILPEHCNMIMDHWWD
jgi:hypothetical protein